MSDRPRSRTARRPAARLGVVALALCAAWAAPLAAQQSAPLRLTLDEVVQRALEASPGLARARAERDAAGAGLRAARAERMPRLDLSASYTRHSDIREFVTVQPDGSELVLFPNLPDRSRLRLGAAVPVYTGGRNAGLIDAARHEREAASRDVETEVADLVLEASAAYWSLVTARESESVLRDALASFDAHVRDAENRERFGMAARNEVLAVRVERDRAELRRLEAEQAAELAQAELRRLLDLEPARRVEPVEPLAAAPAPEQELEPLVAEALAARPERAALAARVAAAEARIGVERAARLPRIDASAGYAYANPNLEIVPPRGEWEDTWEVGLRLSWSVLDGGRSAAAVARATAGAEAARHGLEDLDRRVRLQVTERHLALRTARAAVRVAERNLEAAQENLRVATEREREGVIPSSERLDAESALLSAGLDLTAARAGVRHALAGLDRVLGR